MLKNASIAVRKALIICENRFNICQFCGKKFEREETLAVHVMEKSMMTVSEVLMTNNNKRVWYNAMLLFF
jgi:hypothetical protein